VYFCEFRGRNFRLDQVEKALDGVALPACIAANSGNSPDFAPAVSAYHHRWIAHGA
jgi:hypothetical protein